MTVNPVVEMQTGIGIIRDETKNMDDKLQALEGITEWCDHIDFAIGKYMFGVECSGLQSSSRLYQCNE